jgi:hypothetical protein
LASFLGDVEVAIGTSGLKDTECMNFGLFLWGFFLGMRVGIVVIILLYNSNYRFIQGFLLCCGADTTSERGGSKIWFSLVPMERKESGDRGGNLDLSLIYVILLHPVRYKQKRLCAMYCTQVFVKVPINGMNN